MKTFKDLDLPSEIEKALIDLNYEKPTKVQAAVIPLAENGKDIMSCAETGSGKTAAYLIPVLKKLIKYKSKRALILAPTRELAQQITECVEDLTKYCEKFYTATLVGGMDIRKQFKALKRKPRVFVATPGRLNDHLKRRTVDLKNAEFLILDEGDRMLDMGFAPQLKTILQFLPPQRQTLLFTATLSNKVRELAQNYLDDPETVMIGEPSKPVTSIKQSVVELSSKNKNDRIIDELNNRKGSIIVFARTKRRTDSLANHLSGIGFKVDLIHGGRSQGQRNKAIRNFKDGKCRILCATDVAARGIDVPQVEHVINFDLPMMDEDYVHRIGRTARNGAEGEAVSFITPEDAYSWMKIAKKYKINGIELKNVPSRPPSRGGGRRFGGGGGSRSGGGGRGGNFRRRDSEGSGGGSRGGGGGGRSFGGGRSRSKSSSSSSQSTQKSR